MSRAQLSAAAFVFAFPFLLVLVQKGNDPSDSTPAADAPRAAAPQAEVSRRAPKEDTSADPTRPERLRSDTSRPVLDRSDSGPRTYLETFDDGPGGWYGDRRFALPVWDGVAYCYSPWWTDANHAPPGAGYLHLMLWTYTNKAHYQVDDEYTRQLPYRYSRLAEEGYSRNLTNAKLTVKLRGDGDFKEADLLFVIQTKTDKTTVNTALTGQPFRITRDWSEQTVTLAPDAKQWTCLGARHDMQDVYGCDDIGKALEDVNLDVIFILFPLKVVPAGVEIKEIHVPRAVQDYPVDQHYLPKGLIMFDTIRIDYPE